MTHKVFEPVVLAVLPGAEPSAEKTAQDREFQMAAELAVRELPEELREAFSLRFWHDLNYEEIGSDPGCVRRPGALALLRRPAAAP